MACVASFPNEELFAHSDRKSKAIDEAGKGSGRVSCFFDHIDYIGVPLVYLSYEDLLATHSGYFLTHLEVSEMFRKFKDVRVLFSASFFF